MAFVVVVVVAGGGDDDEEIKSRYNGTVYTVTKETTHSLWVAIIIAMLLLP